MATKGELLYEGKAKRLYHTTEAGLYWMEFKDDATAFDGAKKAVIPGKGYYNAQISAFLFELLSKKGIPSHFIAMVGEREMLVQAGEIIPVEVVVRNLAAGSMAKRLGLAEGTALKRPVTELYYKSDALHDPLVNEDHVAVLDLATAEEVAEMKEQALRVNGILSRFLERAGIVLVDFKLEFARSRGRVLLSDEISPDTCRFWDAQTGDRLDKDRFRRDLGGLTEAYNEVLRRLQRVAVE
ncbi:MAG: phosphoribosylaminoimidazolesuccinocarboxamide synthase [Clostridia bacterium]|nr:phosphoribosylaminoimidazolesuccinocarboxamide synthase [Clostridia bacterium]